MSTDSKLALRFVQARHFSERASKPHDLIVLHDEEAPESAHTALNVALWFSGPAAPQASAHYTVDTDEIIQCVREDGEAWHAPGANDRSIGVEMSGYARQSTADWEADAPMLDRCAELVADICTRRSIPAVFVDADGLLAGTRGITTHAEVDRAYHKSSHTDPGPHFPIAHFLELVADCITGKDAPDITSGLDEAAPVA